MTWNIYVHVSYIHTDTQTHRHTDTHNFKIMRKDGALGGGGGVPIAMPHVNFKKCQCRISLSHIFLDITCRI